MSRLEVPIAIGMKIIFSPIIICVLFFLNACSSDTEKPVSKEHSTTTVTPIKSRIQPPNFNADTAYAYIKKQVDFGPRVPGSSAHAKCADWLTNTLKKQGLDVIVQTETAKTFDGKQFRLKNIIAQFKPEVADRVLLCAHWDARPFADSDTKDKDKPIDGADDGASGVGVLLAIADALKQTPANIGVDIILFDIEDYGSNGDMESWCLGSQHWSANPHKQGYTARYGILLDMVGSKGATFPKEANSVAYAPSIVTKVWNAAAQLGYSNYFIDETISFVGVDDHIYVNKAGIPCIDIIHYDKKEQGFGPHHHTHADNISIIDTATLKAVGQTLLEVIYNE